MENEDTFTKPKLLFHCKQLIRINFNYGGKLSEFNRILEYRIYCVEQNIYMSFGVNWPQFLIILFGIRFSL